MRKDPWAGEPMSRSEAARRYQNLINYQLRPMLLNRRLEDDARINALKRIIREAGRFRYESGVVAGSGTREEVVDLLKPAFKAESGVSEELQDWYKRTIRAFGANIEGED